MALFGGQTNRHDLASLDNLGMTAAIYPSEDQLWVQGPPINDAGDQGVEGPSQAGVVMYPPVPRSNADIDATENLLHEQLNGQTPNVAFEEEWVSLQIGGPPGFGNWNEQPYFTGHSQIVPSNPAAEQGWGVGPARRWAHYPFSEGGNPERNAEVFLRNGSLDWAFHEQNMLYYRSQLAWEEQWAPYKQRVAPTPVVPVPSTVPYVETVPTFAGGYEQYEGIDVPVPALDLGAGIY